VPTKSIGHKKTAQPGRLSGFDVGSVKPEVNGGQEKRVPTTSPVKFPKSSPIKKPPNPEGLSGF
jgi:hypothetical protein